MKKNILISKLAFSLCLSTILFTASPSVAWGAETGSGAKKAAETTTEAGSEAENTTDTDTESETENTTDTNTDSEAEDATDTETEDTDTEQEQPQVASDCMKKVYKNLTKKGSNYSTLKKQDTSTTYKDSFKDNTITISAKGEYISGTWTFSLDGDYITSTWDASEYMGFMGLTLWGDVRDALAEYLGMDVDLVGGYSSVIANRQLDSKYVTFKYNEKNETFTGKLYAAGTYDLSEMDEWYFEAKDLKNFMNKLGDGYINYVSSLGKLVLYTTGNKDSGEIYIAEHGGLTDLTYQSLVNVIKTLKPTGYQTFLNQYAKLKETKTDSYQVSFVSQKKAPEAFSSLDSHYKYLKLRYEAPSFNLGDSLTMKVGGSKTLKVKHGTVKSWKSSKTAIATVKGGKVTAKKKGTATITAVLKDGTKLTCKVTVTAK